MKARATPQQPMAELPKSKKKKKKKKEKKKDSEAAKPALSGGITVAAGTKNAEDDNLEMRRLLRGRRYFTAESEASDRCYNCNEAGHEAWECPQPPQAKPCFVCGEKGHQGNDCPQKLVCYVCNTPGHTARDCQNGSTARVECLRCGRCGHPHSNCTQEYDERDLQLVECYTCRKRGHLCCAVLPPKLIAPVSCSNCGESGHSAEACGCPRGFSGTAVLVATCYRCGEEGHLARGCREGGGGRKHARTEERWQPWGEEERWGGAGEEEPPKRVRRARGGGERGQGGF